jgi:hypothetical protein
MNIRLLSFVLLTYLTFTSVKAQNFPHLNASTGNKNEFIVDADSNIFMFHANRIEKLDKNFNTIWINSYTNLKFKNLLLSKTGSMFFIAATAGKDKIGKIEANGSLTWCTSLPSYTAIISGNTQTVSIASADQMLLDRNADIVITGVTAPFNIAPLYLLKLDTVGNFIKLKLLDNYPLIGPRQSVIINDVSGVYQVSSWGNGFEGPVYNLIYTYSDITDSITTDSIFGIAYQGSMGQNPSFNEQIIKSNKESDAFYVCNSAGQSGNTLNNTFTFRKIKNTVLKWGIQFQTAFPYFMSFQNAEEDHLKNVFLSVSCKHVNTDKCDKWIIKIDSNGLSDNKKYNLIQNFGKATISNEDSITQLKHHYGNRFFYSIETSSSFPGPLSITKMDSTIGSYCSPSASISVTPSTNYMFESGYTTLTSVTSVTISPFPCTVNSVANFSVIINSCIPLNAREYDLNRSLAIYPNPVNTSLNIDSRSDLSIINSSIFDVNGKLILNSDDRPTIDVSKLNPGIYFIKVITDKGELKQKFIKE